MKKYKNSAKFYFFRKYLMLLLPPFVSPHHQNVAFFFFIVILLVQSIGGAPFAFSSDESSSDGERRPIQPRPIFNRSISCQSRSGRSGPLFLGRPVKMNDKKALEWKPLLSSNNSRPPSLEDTIKSYEDKMKMKTNAQQIEKKLRGDLKQIQKRPNGLMQLFLKPFSSFKSKNNEKTQPKNAELIDQFLNYKPMENACEELLPTWDPITKKHYNDYELRMKACRNLHALTGWVAVEKAIGATGKMRLNSLQRFMSTKSTGFGSSNGTLKRLTSLQRSMSTKSMDFAFSKSKMQKNFVKEDIICSVQWDVLRTGMLRLSDKNLKENILEKCRRVNYILQFLILQNLLLKTRPKRDTNEISIEDEKERELKISENLEVYKQKFKEETAELLNSLDKKSNGQQLGEEFNKALIELRDKVVAHWTWLYKQHVH